MGQIHTWITNEQIWFLYGAYVQGPIERIEGQEALAIGKCRFSGRLREDRRVSSEAAAGRRRSRRRSRAVGGTFLAGFAPDVLTGVPCRRRGALGTSCRVEARNVSMTLG